MCKLITPENFSACIGFVDDGKLLGAVLQRYAPQLP